METIANADYTYAKRVCKDLKFVKNLGGYYDLYVPSDTALLPDVFENFRNICLEIYELDPARSFYCIRISMTRNLKKDKSKIRSIN